jgi:membrane protease YdiL (CAAX protease family)
MPVTRAAATLVTGRSYGRELPPQVSLPRDLPPWAAAYSLLVWPAVWDVTEELVYLGYVLPRLQAQLGRTWLAAAAPG